jgi:hypothetical protein
MANSAPYPGKQCFAGPNVRNDRPARWGFRGAHEVGKGHNIYPVILRVRNWIKSRTETNKAATGRVLLREQRTGDAHFVEVGVGGKRFEAGVLTFPPETPDARAAIGFEYGNHEGGTTHLLRLPVSQGKERAICYGLYEAVAQGVCRYAESPDIVLEVYLLHDIGVSCTRLDQRTAISSSSRSTIGKSIGDHLISTQLLDEPEEFIGDYLDHRPSVCRRSPTLL